MYSWLNDTSEWYGKADYKYGKGGEHLRSAAEARAAASGPRTYEKKEGPNEKIIDPTKQVVSHSKNPLIIAIDVTGSMAQWPFEIFDRLPLLYNTLSQYREDLEICFVAIGDSGVDRWPLQVTGFANGYDLEQLLGALYGEGGGGDSPESYGLLAHWVNTHVSVPKTDEKPFLIVFGDATMHEEVPAAQVNHYLGEGIKKKVNSIEAWNKVSENWNTWFLRRPTTLRGDAVDQQWAKAVGEQKIFHIEDEQRAVDYAMGLIARAWGYFGDFQENMLARQSKEVVGEVLHLVELVCPRCGAPIPVDAKGMFKCAFCGTTLKL